MDALTQDIRTYTHLIQLELKSHNSEDTYGLCFSRLTKPDLFRVLDMGRHLGNGEPTVLMIGTDQRDQFVPLLKAQGLNLSKGANILDLGCGDGKTSYHLLRELRHDTNITLIDPNREYLSLYTGMIRHVSDTIHVERVIVAGFDEAMVDRLLARSDLILLIHAIYFATNSAALLNFVLDHLRAHGRAFIVFADEFSGYTGAMI